MITETYTIYKPTLIPNLIFVRQTDCELFEQALNDMLKTTDWKSEWREATQLIYTQQGYFHTMHNLLEDPDFVAKFNDDVSPTISNLLYLSEYATDQILENENVDKDNTYYPVLCFLAFIYK